MLILKFNFVVSIFENLFGCCFVQFVLKFIISDFLCVIRCHDNYDGIIGLTVLCTNKPDRHTHKLVVIAFRYGDNAIY